MPDFFPATLVGYIRINDQENDTFRSESSFLAFQLSRREGGFFFCPLLTDYGPGFFCPF